MRRECMFPCMWLFYVVICKIVAVLHDLEWLVKTRIFLLSQQCKKLLRPTVCEDMKHCFSSVWLLYMCVPWVVIMHRNCAAKWSRKCQTNRSRKMPRNCLVENSRVMHVYVYPITVINNCPLIVLSLRHIWACDKSCKVTKKFSNYGKLHVIWQYTIRWLWSIQTAAKVVPSCVPCKECKMHASVSECDWGLF